MLTIALPGQLPKMDPQDWNDVRLLTQWWVRVNPVPDKELNLETHHEGKADLQLKLLPPLWRSASHS